MFGVIPVFRTDCQLQQVGTHSLVPGPFITFNKPCPCVHVKFVCMGKLANQFIRKSADE